MQNSVFYSVYYYTSTGLLFVFSPLPGILIRILGGGNLFEVVILTDVLGCLGMTNVLEVVGVTNVLEIVGLTDL